MYIQANKTVTAKKRFLLKIQKSYPHYVCMDAAKYRYMHVP